MEEKKEIKITEKEAKDKIIQKLRNRKIVCSLADRIGEDISNDNFDMDINSAIYYPTWSNGERDYSKVNIQISTKEYPHTRRRLNDFDVINGDYKLLVEKVNFIIEEDMIKKQAEQLKGYNEKNNLKILKEKLQGLGAKKEQYGDSLNIKTKYFTISFFATDTGIDVDIEDDREMTIDQAIELIKKLK